MSLPICGIHPIVQQHSVWHLYRIISENISEWKCMAFAKVLTTVPWSSCLGMESVQGGWGWGRVSS